MRKYENVRGLLGFPSTAMLQLLGGQFDWSHVSKTSLAFLSMVPSEGFAMLHKECWECSLPLKPVCIMLGALYESLELRTKLPSVALSVRLGWLSYNHCAASFWLSTKSATDETLVSEQTMSR